MANEDGPLSGALGLYEDVGTGLLVYGLILGSLTVPTTAFTWIESAAGVRSLPDIFLPLAVLSAVAVAMVVAGTILIRIDERHRQQRLQSFDSPPW